MDSDRLGRGDCSDAERQQDRARRDAHRGRPADAGGGLHPPDDDPQPEGHAQRRPDEGVGQCETEMPHQEHCSDHDQGHARGSPGGRSSRPHGIHEFRPLGGVDGLRQQDPPQQVEGHPDPGQGERHEGDPHDGGVDPEARPDAATHPCDHPVVTGSHGPAGTDRCHGRDDGTAAPGRHWVPTPKRWAPLGESSGSFPIGLLAAAENTGRHGRRAAARRGRFESQRRPGCRGR